MIRDPKHGIHYLVDFYQFLELDRSATQDEIRAKYREKTKLYHPDRLQGTAPEFVAKAERISRILTEAYETLTDESKRAAYNTLLDRWEGPISIDGEPATFSGRNYWNVYGLAGLTDREYSDYLFIRDLANSFVVEATGVDPDTHALLEEQFDASDTPTPRLRNAYEKSLAKMDEIIASEEGGARELLDLGPAENYPELDYLGYTNTLLAERKEQILAETERTVRALHSGELKAIGSGAEAVAKDAARDLERAIDHYRIVATVRFDDAALKVRELAERRQKLIQRRFSIYAPTYLEGSPTNSDHLLSMVEINDRQFWIMWHLDGDEVCQDQSFDPTETEGFESLEDARPYAEANVSVMHVPLPTGLPYFDCLQVAACQHFERIGTARESEPELDARPSEEFSSDHGIERGLSR